VQSNIVMKLDFQTLLLLS